MKRDEAAYLLDMLLAAQDALEFSSSLTFQQFAQDRLRQNAVFKCIEIIGEAATHVEEKTKRKNPKVPWQNIIGTRNRLAHGYFQISLEVVWDIVKNDIPQLIDLLKTLVPPEAK
ncbi:MAG: DUF86 domain-containing protein [Candidatus Dadabacteria bacterium]|nr:DUF86 domain-containing protein [Candidatus Dadabacteria bacterium]MDE0519459.1 DUF86 domain-containing protein [Candidatus Dadabacteria bacterium]MDE0663718.1 DUF86 domain-containing protein [Candidatus Dadabacteria bacterium]